MSRRVHLRAVLLFATTIVFTGCPDDTVPSANIGDAGRDPGILDSNNGEVTFDVPSDVVIDGEDAACFPCDGDDECDELGDYWCDTGCCVPDEPGSCTRHGDPCESDTESTESFVCDTELERCLARCVTFDASDCPYGSTCFATDEATDEFDGACLPGDCNDTCHSPQACPDGGAWQCDAGDGAASGTCHPWGNDASFCAPAGTAELGADCVTIAEDFEATLTCVSGMFCFRGECVEACAYNAMDPSEGCDAPDACVPVFEQAGDNWPGVCDVGCDPWSAGECPEGQRCEPNTAPIQGGLTAWTCVDALTDGYGALIPTVNLGDSCDADGTDGYDTQCVEGAYCIEYANDAGVGRCVTTCDSTLQSDAELAVCPVVRGDPLVLTDDFIDYGTRTQQRPVDAGDNLPFQVWEEGEGGDAATRFGPAMLLNLADQTLTSLFATTDGTAYGVHTFFDWDAASVDATGTDEVMRVYNLTATEIDLFRALDSVLTVELTPQHSNTPGFTQLTADTGAGALGFYAETEDDAEVEGSWFGLLSSDTRAANVKLDFVAIGGIMDDIDGGTPGQIVVLEDDHPDLTVEGDDDLAVVRLLHAASGIGEIDVDWGPSDDADETGLELAGATATWFTRYVGDGDNYDTTVTVSYGDSDTATLAVDDLQNHHFYTVILFNPEADPITDGYIIIDSTDAAVTGLNYRLTNVSSADVTFFGFEVPMARGIDAGGSAPDVPGGQLIDPGDYDLLARESADVEGAEYDPYADVVAMIDAPINVPDGDGLNHVLSVVVSTQSGAEPVGTIDAWTDDTPTLTAGATQLLFHHFAHGKRGLQLFTGDRQTVCAPTEVEGLGHCMNECTPLHTTDVTLVDDDGLSTGAWEANGCPQHMPEGMVWRCQPFELDSDAQGIAGTEDGPTVTGYCLDLDEVFAGRDFGEGCGSDESTCFPDSLCVDFPDHRDGSTSQCVGMCTPYEAEAEGCPFDDDVCVNTIDQAEGFCATMEQIDALNTEVGDACTSSDAGRPCNANNAFCLGVSDGATTDYRCRSLCRSTAAEGEGAPSPDCPPIGEETEDRDCLNVSLSGHNPSWPPTLPSWLGVCDL